MLLTCCTFVGPDITISRGCSPVRLDLVLFFDLSCLLRKRQERSKKSTKSKRTGEQPREMVISGPTNVQHVSSIGFNPNSQAFEVKRRILAVIIKCVNTHI